MSPAPRREHVPGCVKNAVPRGGFMRLRRVVELRNQRLGRCLLRTRHVDLPTIVPPPLFSRLSWCRAASVQKAASSILLSLGGRI